VRAGRTISSCRKRGEKRGRPTASGLFFLVVGRGKKEEFVGFSHAYTSRIHGKRREKKAVPSFPILRKKCCIGRGGRRSSVLSARKKKVRDRDDGPHLNLSATKKRGKRGGEKGFDSSGWSWSSYQEGERKRRRGGKDCQEMARCTTLAEKKGRGGRRHRGRKLPVVEPGILEGAENHRKTGGKSVGSVFCWDSISINGIEKGEEKERRLPII